MFHKMKPAAVGARRASGFIEQQFCELEDRPSQETEQDLIRVEMIGAENGRTLSLAVITGADHD